MTAYTKHMVLTGGSSGIGYEAVKELTKDPQTLVVVGSRRPPPDLPANAEFHALDLSNLESVREFAAWYPYASIDAFIACAGVAPSGTLAYVDGIESTFYTNHVGHALLFFLLSARDLFPNTAAITIVGSSLHDVDNPKGHMKPSWTTADAVAHTADDKMTVTNTYPNSKLANSLFSYAIARRALEAQKHWQVNIFDPGFVPGGGSQLHRNAGALVGFLMDYVVPHLTFILRWQGIVTSTAVESGFGLADLVTNPKYAGTTGKMVRVLTEMQPGKQAVDESLQDDLWDWTVEYLKLTPAQAKL